MREGWIYKKLGDCFPYIKNGANIKQIKDADGLPITRIETLSNGLFNRDKMGYANIMEIGKYSEYVLEDQDLLMSHINSKTYIGRTVEYKKEGDEVIIHGMNLLKLKADKTIIIPRFFYYYSFSQKFKFDVSCVRKDAVNQSSMAIGDLKRFNLPIPPISTQQQIVSELDLLNHIIDQKRQQLKEYDALAESIFYEMFGDPVENPKGWEVKKLGDISEVATGSTPDRKNDTYYGGSIPWVKTTEVAYCDIFSTEETITEEGLRNSNCKIFHSGTILMAMYGQGKTRGQVAFLRIDATTNQACAAIILYSQNDTMFIYYQLRLLYNSIRAMAQGCNQANLNLSLVRKIEVALPPLSLQRQFAAKIESIEQQKQLLKESIKETEMLFQSRMDYWFNV